LATELTPVNYLTTFAAPVAPGDTTVTLALAPVAGITSGNWRLVTTTEVMLVTGVAGSVCTVTRAAEPLNGVSTARSHAAGEACVCGITGPGLAALIPNLAGGVTSLASSGGTITVSASTGAVNVDLALAKANTWTAVQTMTGARGANLLAFTDTTQNIPVYVLFTTPIGVGPDLNIGTGADRLILGPSGKTLRITSNTQEWPNGITWSMGGQNIAWSGVATFSVQTEVANTNVLVCGYNQNTVLRGYSTGFSVVVAGAASRTVGLLQLQTSAGGTLGWPGGCIFDDITTVSTTHTNGTFDALSTHAVVANGLALNGDKVRATYTLTIVSSATATREIQVTFAGITIFDSTALTFAATGTIKMLVEIVRLTSSTCRATVTFLPSGSSTILADQSNTYTPDSTLTGLTLTGSNNLVVQAAAAGTGAASGDISLVQGTGGIYPQGS
jgi:hypothetical protein